MNIGQKGASKVHPRYLQPHQKRRQREHQRRRTKVKDGFLHLLGLLLAEVADEVPYKAFMALVAIYRCGAG